MPDRLVDFIRVLRTHDLQVSPAESVDAVRVASLLGYTDRDRLRDGLCMALAKSPGERVTFLSCFDRYFSRQLGDFSIKPEESAVGELASTGGDAAGPRAGTAGASSLQEAADSHPRLGQLLESPLMRALMTNDRNSLGLAISQAADRAGIGEIRIFTQKGQYSRRILAALGEQQLREAIIALEREDNPVLPELLRYRDVLRAQVRDYLDSQYLLYAEGRNRQMMDEILSETRLSNIEQVHLQRTEELVRRLAKRLAARYSPRRKEDRRGQLDMRRTMSRGVAHGGLMFNLHWRRTRRQRPQIFAICDVSGSVAPYARFLLLFLYSLQDVLPRVRSFAFSNRLGEVSALFRDHPVAKAIEFANHLYGGATDYGAALRDFANLALEDVRSGSTVIVLGDARNNYGDPGLEILQQVYQRADRVLWLNPENRRNWGSGDSEMLRYQNACHFTAECNNLRQLERTIEQILRSAR